MPEVAVLYDPQSGRWLRFLDLVEEIEVNRLEQVLEALRYVEQRVEQARIFAAGFVSYEAAAAFDAALQTAAPGDFPLLRFGLFARAEQIKLHSPVGPPEPVNWQPQEDITGFARKVSEIREAIARGDTYQVNLTFFLNSPFAHDPWTFFQRLVHDQKAGGAGYLESRRWAICSTSPELFFTRDGDQLRMRPMKGTAKRGRTLDEDHLQAEALQRSPKNRAENIMILDMVRNDLGRLAHPGAVHTDEICTLEKYPTVWQLTSQASARSSASLAEIFQALFPCASITGAPKAKTMQIIAALEAMPRQIYTGTFGWIAPDRKARFNVAIRTVLIDKQLKRACYGTGAGITWGSESADEYLECLDKAAVLTSPAGDFALIETLRWTPAQGYFILAEHLGRLQASATYFDFKYSAERVSDYLQTLAKGFPDTAQRVRLLLHKNGRLEATVTTLHPDKPSVLRIRLASQPVDSRDRLLFHKTTHRQIYEKLYAERAGADEVVLWNEHGEVTECCTSNLVVEQQGRFVTPPVASGLLPGTYRAFLLQRGILSEQRVTKDDLRESPRIYLINAVRKWRRAELYRDHVSHPGE